MDEYNKIMKELGIEIISEVINEELYKKQKEEEIDWEKLKKLVDENNIEPDQEVKNEIS